ncbi:hypothetical protein A3A20_02875 [Candidatus Wolfebacteria bacterium RIFCSPLOWO2_01_FULL_45_19]|uniref:DUF458 domain-containing protein n=1 Tax=Candidatus Wolfebacteria bacterium RIFCSPLOWO2_01_FULL_45_19 TaxID=1802557 RepID=A0A1F8DUG9_9BACT|nr:MAG: hypothetical protein UX23_C0005G0021 [Parcubacteria group bacterium GW2011_GWB1_45_9]OGM91485.1 MAG: hypothetical protein A3A20_02875 [Candidatus Wolfebacteria bacterium RIFCSPLOWO2_01_FULL_45_19]
MFRDASGLQLNTDRMIEAIVSFMRDVPNRRYKIMVGTDSVLSSDGSADFATAIVVHRVGNGGRYFWRRMEFSQFHTLRDRIIREVLVSLDAARELLEEFRRSENVPHFDFEIHADIGEKGETKVMMQEVLGMIRAYNFEARTKPESYAASKVADRHT